MSEKYPTNNFKGKNIISILDFTRENIDYLVKKTLELKGLENKGQRYNLNHLLNDKKLATLFYEDSTRTRTSFQEAMRELGGKHLGFSGKEGTSLMKNENIFSTTMMYLAYHSDGIVMRHNKDGSVQWTADIANVPVINGGDGTNEHPTQALLDMVTINEIQPGIDNLVIGMGGDLKYGRTIRSLSLALSLYDNIKIMWSADDKLAMPQDLVKILEDRNVKVIRVDSPEEAMKNSKIFYMTRPQIERFNNTITKEEIFNIMKKYRITIDKIKTDVKILHPLPINKEIAEIDFDVFHSPNEYFFTEAENGLFLRKALLIEILANSDYVQFNPYINREIVKANNREALTIKEKQVYENLFIDKITSGTVIDHVPQYFGRKILNTLGLEEKGYTVSLASSQKSTRHSKKDIIKINGPNLTERELKIIAMESPKATFNIIEEGKVIEKFNYSLCTNTNCITRDVTEDVPPRFDEKNKQKYCHYCNHEYL